MSSDFAYEWYKFWHSEGSSDDGVAVYACRGARRVKQQVVANVQNPMIDERMSEEKMVQRRLL